MSIGDSALQVGTLGRAATLFMGGSAAASQAQSVMARGGSNRQALWGGLAAGAAEMLFEYVSINNLLKPKTVTDWKSFLRETVKQAGVEGSEELFTEVANILSDAAIMRGKSETALREAAYEAGGAEPEGGGEADLSGLCKPGSLGGGGRRDIRRSDGQRDRRSELGREHPTESDREKGGCPAGIRKQGSFQGRVCVQL